MKKTLIITAILCAIAHAAAGALMESSSTISSLKNQKAQTELAVEGM
jgi:hypothetical protein